jgi:hypothetical protein
MKRGQALTDKEQKLVDKDKGLQDTHEQITEEKAESAAKETGKKKDDKTKLTEEGEVLIGKVLVGRIVKKGDFYELHDVEGALSEKNRNKMVAKFTTREKAEQAAIVKYEQHQMYDKLGLGDDEDVDLDGDDGTMDWKDAERSMETQESRRLLKEEGHVKPEDFKRVDMDELKESIEKGAGVNLDRLFNHLNSLYNIVNKVWKAMGYSAGLELYVSSKEHISYMQGHRLFSSYGVFYWNSVKKKAVIVVGQDAISADRIKNTKKLTPIHELLHPLTKLISGSLRSWSVTYEQKTSPETTPYKELYESYRKRLLGVYRELVEALQEEIKASLQGKVKNPLLSDYLDERYSGRELLTIKAAVDDILYSWQQDDPYHERTPTPEVKKKIAKLVYGLMSTDEMVSEAYGNSDFQQLLNSIKVKKKGPVTKGRPSLLTSILEAIIDLFKGIGMRLDKDSLLAELNSTMEDFLYQIDKGDLVPAHSQAFQNWAKKKGYELDPKDKPPKKARIPTPLEHLAEKLAESYYSPAKLKSVIFKINEALDEEQKLKKADITKLMRLVKNKMAATPKGKKVNTLVEKLSTVLSKKGPKGLRVARWLSYDTASLIKRLRGAMEEKDLAPAEARRIKYEEDKLTREMTPEEDMQYLYDLITTFPLLEIHQMNGVIKMVDAIMEQGRNEYLEAKAKVSMEKAKRNTKGFGVLTGGRYGPVKFFSPFGDYKKGDRVVRGRYIYTLPEDLTGQEINEALKEKKRAFPKVVALPQVTKYKLDIARRMGRGLRSLTEGVLGLEDLLERISTKASKYHKQYFGPLSWISDAFRTADTQSTIGSIKVNSLIEGMRLKIFGEGSAKKMRARIVEGQEEVSTAFLPAELRAEYIDEESGADNKISRNRLLNLWMIVQSEDIGKRFINEEHDPVAIKEAIEKNLPPHMIRWGEFLMKFYDRYYKGINEVYKEVTGTDLGKIPGYSPVGTPFDAKYTGAAAELLGYKKGGPISIFHNEFKERVSGSLPHLADPDIMVRNFVRKMEHFKAHAEIFEKVRPFFNNTTIRNTIEAEFGSQFNTLIDGSLDSISLGYIDKRDMDGFIEKLRLNFQRASLGANLSLFPKQMMSFAAYMNAMQGGTRQGVANYLKYAPLTVPHFLQYIGDLTLAGWNRDKVKPRKGNLFHHMMSSDYINQRLGTGWDRDIRLHNEDLSNPSKFNRKLVKHFPFLGKSQIWNGMMIATRFGDVGAILIGGYPVFKQAYDMAIADNQSHEEAIKSAEKYWGKVSDLSQQSARMMDLGAYQRGTVWDRSFTMFMTTPIQYWRQTSTSIFKFRHVMNNPNSTAQEKFTAWNNMMKRISLYHVLLPVMFAWASQGFQLGLDEDDDWDAISALISSIVTGSFTGLYLLGPMVRWGKKGTDKLEEEQGFTDEELADWILDVAIVFGQVKGIPVAPTQRTISGTMSLLAPNKDINYTNSERFLRVFGYSDASIPSLRNKTKFKQTGRERNTRRGAKGRQRNTRRR